MLGITCSARDLPLRQSASSDAPQVAGNLIARITANRAFSHSLAQWRTKPFAMHVGHVDRKALISAEGHLLPSRMGWRRSRCAPDSCRRVAPPDSGCGGPTGDTAGSAQYFIFLSAKSWCTQLHNKDRHRSKSSGAEYLFSAIRRQFWCAIQYGLNPRACHKLTGSSLELES